MHSELVIRGGDVVIEGATVRADVAVSGGRIVAVSSTELPGERVVDASGCLVLPGGVDPHVHLTEPWVDDFESGTRAAAMGGVTTVGNMTFPEPGERLVDACDRVAADVGRQAVVDVVLHPVVSELSHLDAATLPQLRARGHRSLKVFTMLETFQTARRQYYEFLTAAAGQGFLVMAHCEDEGLIGFCTARLVAAGTADFRHFGDSRPVAAEEAAVHQMIAFAETSGTAIYVVHLSSARALAACAQARARGVPIFVETRPLYLYLTERLLHEADGAKYIGQPPLREQADVDALWAGMRFGTVDTLGTDHAPWTLDQKLAAGGSLDDLRPGVADLETVRPMLFSEGVRTGKLSLARFVELTATNPARLLGLYPNKGVIAPGSDADLVVWDPEETRTIDGSTFQSRARFSPYDGAVVQGWPREVISRGDVIVANGKLQAEAGRGTMPQRGPTAAW